MSEIDVVDDLEKFRIHFTLHTALWDSFDSNILNIVSSSIWSEIKLFLPDGEKNPLLNTIPNNQGGIYLFLAKSIILPETHLYLLYIGRAHISSNQNLRKRCSQYPTEEKRPKIKRMIEQWGQHLYIRYLPLDDNTIIDNIESELINKILPPFNSEIPNKQIRDAVQAFL